MRVVTVSLLVLFAVAGCDKGSSDPHAGNTVPAVEGGAAEGDEPVEVSAEPAPDPNPEAVTAALRTVEREHRELLADDGGECAEVGAGPCLKMLEAEEWKGAMSCLRDQVKAEPDTVCARATQLLTAVALEKAGDDEAAHELRQKAAAKASKQTRGILAIVVAEHLRETEDKRRAGYYYKHYQLTPEEFRTEALDDHVRARCAETDIQCQGPKLNQIKVNPQLIEGPSKPKSPVPVPE